MMEGLYKHIEVKREQGNSAKQITQWKCQGHPGSCKKAS